MWLIEGIEEAPAQSRPPSRTQTSQWLPPAKSSPKRSSNGGTTKAKTAKKTESTERSQQAEPSKPNRLNVQSNQRLESKLRRATEQNQALQETVEELRRHIAELESAASTNASKPKRQQKSQRSSTRGGQRRKLDLNNATFEELRAIGLSVTQSARLIATRDLRGGFKKIDEVDNLAGFAAGTIEDLKKRAKVT